ncbi:MAG: class B sortase [Lachnospiraceae bacterium]
MKRKIMYMMAALSIVSIFACLLYLYQYNDRSRVEQDLYSSLSDIKQEAEEQEPESDLLTNSSIDHPDEGTNSEAALTELFKLNSDLVGWITIDGTLIDYPVVQSKTDADYYLTHNFYKEVSQFGCPYVQAGIDVTEPSDNIIIHGHNMKDASMFAGLIKFKKEAFGSEYRYITFETQKKKRVYELMAVFVIAADENASTIYGFTDASDPVEFEEFVEECSRRSLYDTGVTAEYGDKLLTLSTCDYSVKDGRLVVVAKEIK